MFRGIMILVNSIKENKTYLTLHMSRFVSTNTVILIRETQYFPNSVDYI